MQTRTHTHAHTDRHDCESTLSHTDASLAVSLACSLCSCFALHLLLRTQTTVTSQGTWDVVNLRLWLRLALRVRLARDYYQDWRRTVLPTPARCSKSRKALNLQRQLRLRQQLSCRRRARALLAHIPTRTHTYINICIVHTLLSPLSLPRYVSDSDFCIWMN